MAQFVPPGNTRSGDLEFVDVQPDSAVVAVVDGLGHGESAARAAELATQTIRAHVQEPLTTIVQRCHDALRCTRGVVMSIAAIDLEHRMLNWLGIGNVRAVLCRPEAAFEPRREELLLRSGVVGVHLPSLRVAAMPIAAHDTIIFATDGIRSEFADRLAAFRQPQDLAQRILAEYCRQSDDALVVVAQLN